jgi:hypothetical protein
VIPHRPGGEQAAAQLDRHEGQGEDQAAVAERLGDRHGHDHAHHHGHEQHDPHRRPLGIQPVGDPGREDPGPPDRHQQQTGLDQAQQARMGQQAVRQLGDREHEHQVEEQLDIGDPRMAARGAVAEHVAA